jgi:hypothetical protein
MDLNSKNILAILNVLIGGEIVKTPLGEGLSINNREAFLFSAITGSAYFENQIFPFTPKGLLKIFYNALDFNFVTGIFDNNSIKNTPYFLTQHRKYLKSNQKIIVPLEIKSEKDLKFFLDKNYPNQTFDTDILIMRIDLSKKGYGLESFMEYITCKFFSHHGYITENQIPLSHSLGSPDFGGFGLSKIQETLFKFNLLPFGFNVLELSMLRAFPIHNNKIIKNKSSDNLIVGEAKTSTSSMNLQLEKYISSNFFDIGIEIHPSKSNATNPKFGLLSIKDAELFYSEPSKQENFSKSKEQDKYKEWLKTYFNCYLIANYSNDELRELGKTKFNNKLESKDDLLSLVKDVNLEDHLIILTEFIKNGTFQ